MSLRKIKLLERSYQLPAIHFLQLFYVLAGSLPFAGQAGWGNQLGLSRFLYNDWLWSSARRSLPITSHWKPVSRQVKNRHIRKF